MNVASPYLQKVDDKVLHVFKILNFKMMKMFVGVCEAMRAHGFDNKKTAQ